MTVLLVVVVGTAVVVVGLTVVVVVGNAVVVVVGIAVVVVVVGFNVVVVVGGAAVVVVGIAVVVEVTVLLVVVEVVVVVVTVTASPLKATVWGLPNALLAILKAPLRVPAAVGLKVTITLQKPPMPSPVAPQLLFWLKSALVLLPVRLKAALPELVRVMVWAVLAVPRFWLAKVMPVALN